MCTGSQYDARATRMSCVALLSKSRGLLVLRNLPKLLAHFTLAACTVLRKLLIMWACERC